MTRSEHIKALLAEYAQRRAHAEAQRDMRIAEVSARDPEIDQLRINSASVALEAMRKLVGAPVAPETARSIAESAKLQGLKNNRELRARLAALSLSEDYLETQYACPLCGDTGYVGDLPAKFCDCFRAALTARQHEDGSMAGIHEQNFESFDPNFAPAEAIENAGYDQRAQLAAAKALCESYANSFPATKLPNLLLMGAGGLGKTFLLNCIFARVIERGKPAVRITAFRMFEAMRKQHIGSEPDFDGFSSLIETPLLLIDDLGTEPMMRNITIEYLFTLLNERTSAGRHTVVATNLTPEQIRERYGERVSSRLLDKGRCIPVRLKGRDLRTL